MTVEILKGNCIDTLKTLEEASVNCCVTSPPYWGLRDYGVDGQMGMESSPEEYVENMLVVFRNVRRVLRDDGTLWLNLGDSYCSAWASGRRNVIGNGSRDNRIDRMPSGLKEKDLVGIPWRVAFALQADGWYLRQDIIWHKPNPMPESVTDRCTKSHEYIFLLSKSQKYWYDADAIKEKAARSTKERMDRGVSADHKNSDGAPGQTPHGLAKPRLHKSLRKKAFDKTMAGGGTNIDGHTGDKKPNGEYFDYILTGKRNKRSVWTVTTKPYKGAHFATFPPELILPCILAGCPKDGTVLDPFGGSGTTAVVAREHGRNAILCELNEEYIGLIKKRLVQDVLSL